MRGLIHSEFALFLGLVILFAIFWGLTKLPAPISSVASAAERYAQPH